MSRWTGGSEATPGRFSFVASLRCGTRCDTSNVCPMNSNPPKDITAIRSAAAARPPGEAEWFLVRELNRLRGRFSAKALAGLEADLIEYQNRNPVSEA